MDFDAGHGGCMVVGEVVKGVDAVLDTLDSLSIWGLIREPGIEDADI